MKLENNYSKHKIEEVKLFFKLNLFEKFCYLFYKFSIILLVFSFFDFIFNYNYMLLIIAGIIFYISKKALKNKK